MTAGPSTTLSRQTSHDLQNEAIKSLFTQTPNIHSNPKIPVGHSEQHPEDGSVQVVKVREAWAPLPEEANAVVASKVPDGVTRRVSRHRSDNRKILLESEGQNVNEAEHMERNLNDAINNNGNEEEEEEKRRTEDEVNVKPILAIIWLSLCDDTILSYRNCTYLH